MPRQEQITLREGTAAAWTTANPTLALGEPGFETDTGNLKIGDGTTPWTTLKYAQSGAYVAPSVAMAAATGTAATDTANLYQAINDVPAGGRLWLPSSSTFYAIDPSIHQIAATKNITIEGDALTPTYTSQTAGGSPEVPSSPFLSGAVLKIVTAGYDAVQLSGSGMSANLKNLGIVFASGLASTGHAINATPNQTFGTGHDYGVTDFRWDNVQVYGHDGNHYAFRLINPQYGTLSHLRSYGGGIMYVAADGNAQDYGNLVVIGPYGEVHNGGTAGGYIHSSAANYGAAGNLNLITYIRPQCNSNAGTAPMYSDLAGAGVPSNITLIAPDFETAGSNTYTPGSGTVVVGTPHIGGGFNTNVTSYGIGALPYGPNPLTATAVGNSALKSATTGTSLAALGGSALSACTTGIRNTAVGDSALAAITTASESTAVGAWALQNATGGSNTAVGSQSAHSLTTGNNNTAVGQGALYTNTSGTMMTAVGLDALYNSTGSYSTAVGGGALGAATTPWYNTAVGYEAFGSVTTGGACVAIGAQAGVTATSANQTTTASNQTLVGYQTGQSSATQVNNITCLGYQALAGGAYATALGSSTSAGGSGAVAIGTDHTGAGASSGTQDLIVLGTANHTTCIPGLPAFVSGDHYLVVDSSGNIHKSSLGPAS